MDIEQRVEIEEEPFSYEAMDEEDQIMGGIKRHQPPDRGRQSPERGPLPKRGRSLPSHFEVLPIKEELESQQEESRKLTWEDSPYADDTTLFKAVHYYNDRIQKDEEEKEISQLFEDLRNKKIVTKIYKDGQKQYIYTSYFELLITVGVHCGPHPFRAGPVLQVKSITISNPTNSSCDDFEMYGEISITDYRKNTFYIYKCEEDDEPEHVCSRWPLLFTGCPIAPVMGGKVKFSLTNVHSGHPIFKDEVCDLEENGHYLDYSSKEDDRDKEITQTFPGSDGYCATVVYTKIPFAALAKVEMFLRYTPPLTTSVSGEEETTFKVHGTIKVNNVVCFERDDSKPVDKKYGACNGFEQSRYVFAVPADSPLVVECSLHNGDTTFANGKHSFEPSYSRVPVEVMYNFPHTAENYCVDMYVHWILHEDFFDKGGVWSHTDVNVAFGPYIIPKSIAAEAPKRALVEIFSVIFGGVGDLSSSALPALCGTIVVRDREGPVYIFSRNAECPDKLPKEEQQQFRTLSLAWPGKWWFVEKKFYMNLRLKDVHDNVVCKGYLSWRAGTDSERYDSRICDVIRGDEENSSYYAAVHYSVFKNGKKAKVTVKRCSSSKDDDGYSIVYGSVFVEYANYGDYPSTYDRDCYRVIVFKRSKEDCVTVKNSFEIPLSKSHFSAPADCEKIIVDADLWISHSMDPPSFQHVAERFTLNAAGNQNKHLQNEHLEECILVDVDWSY